MPRYAILRQASTSPDLFQPVRQQLRDRNLWDEAGDGAIEEWLSLPYGPRAGEQFDRAAAFIFKSLNGGRILTVLVDQLNPLLMNPLRANGWPTLVAMLVLAFPEVRWHALVLTGRPREGFSGEAAQELERWQSFQAQHGITALFDPRGTPLFDGYGLRQHVLDCMFHDEDQERRNHRSTYRIRGSVPGREALATVLDEEEGYRWLLAYMAYRHGFRVCAIAFWQEAVQLLGPEGHLARTNRKPLQPQSQAASFLLSLEDWFLSYPDQIVPSMSDLRRRSTLLPALTLQGPPLRRFLTVGHQHQPSKKMKDRMELLKEIRNHEIVATGYPLQLDQQLSFKPASGLYTLWKELGLDRNWNSSGSHSSNEAMRRKQSGLAPGFFWPPEAIDDDDSHDVEDGHSSPGRLLHIAEHLLDRANASIKEVNTAAEALRGAVLATQALELLGGKTPTVSVEALLLKHAFEVTAECQFPGVEYHLNLKERLFDIRKNLASMSIWLNENRQTDFILNGEAQILSRLAAILEEYGEYEEAELCHQELRDLHRKISVRYDRKTRPGTWRLIWPFRWYIVFVLKSTKNFILSMVVLVCVFWAAHYLDKQYPTFYKKLRIDATTVPQNENGALTAENLRSQPIRKPNIPKGTLPSNTAANPDASRSNSSADVQHDSVGPSDTLYDTFKAIISGEPVDKGEKSIVTRGISYAASLLGVLNLGILISVLHSRMNRR
jgi:hypothetical protein